MRYISTLWLCLWLSTLLLAQNNQINWTRSRALHDGSATNGVKLSAKGLYLNLIELAPMLAEHQEFTGRASNVGSFTITQQHPLFVHATNVASVGAASGVVPAAKGIAFGATIRNYNDNGYPTIINQIALPTNDIGQRLVVNASSGGILVDGGLTNALYCGTYDPMSNTVDDIAYKNPYCLQVVPAGNEGKMSNSKPNSVPLDWQYDRLAGQGQTAKNTLVVGNIFDMNLTDKNQLVYAFINANSSSGPTDDFRIKPELMAPGNQLTMATRGDQFSDQFYKAYTNSVNGTSLSSPIVAGVALLLQELYYNRNKQYMRAATVKGLLMHTADKVYPTTANNPKPVITWGISANEGPDPFAGYGVINATAAAQVILTRGMQYGSILDEKILRQDQPYTLELPTKSGQPVTVSISWTDPARYDLNAPFAVSINDTDPKLVNDLGVVVVERVKNTLAITRLFYPYSLSRKNQQLTTINDKPNRVDPYEKIRFIPQPEHTYSLSITADNGALWNDQQPYTLIVTGLGQDEDPLKATCVANKVINQPIRVGTNEEVTTQITLGAEVTPGAGLIEFNAPNLLLTNGAAIRNSDALLLVAGCSRSGQRQVAIESVDSTALRPGLTGEADVQLYPNPAGDYCWLKSPMPITHIGIYSLAGHLLWQQASAPTTEIRLTTNGLPAGQYILLLEDAFGVKKTKKMNKL